MHIDRVKLQKFITKLAGDLPKNFTTKKNFYRLLQITKT